MDKSQYAEYLNHPLWIEKREEVFQRFGRECCKCKSIYNLNVHHKTYSPGKMPWEYPLENFEVLCEKCHKIDHGLEYSAKYCKECGIEISERFEYCFTCYQGLNLKLKNKVASLENQIKHKPENTNKGYSPNFYKGIHSTRFIIESDRLKRARDSSSISEGKFEYKFGRSETNRKNNSKITNIIHLVGVVISVFLITLVLFETYDWKEHSSETINDASATSEFTKKDFVTIDNIEFYNNKYTKVTGEVRSTFVPKSKKVVFLNFGSDYKKCFSVVIFEKDLENFFSKGIYPDVYYKNKILEVSGLVKLYKGKSEIICKYPTRLNILGDEEKMSPKKQASLSAFREYFECQGHARCRPNEEGECPAYSRLSDNGWCYPH